MRQLTEAHREQMGRTYQRYFDQRESPPLDLTPEERRIYLMAYQVGFLSGFSAGAETGVDVGYDAGVDAAVLEMMVSLSPESGSA